MTSPAFVGRARELTALDQALEQADGGAPAVLLVGGEAGVGKTRLVTEFAARRAGNGTRVLVGGCVPVADGGLPFAPAVEALRDLVGQLGVEPVRALAGPSWPELARLLPALGDPDRDGPAGAAAEATGQVRLFELVLGLLAALANQIDRKLWEGLPSIPLYQQPTFLAWRETLRNVVENPTLEGPLWNAESWAFAAEASP
jgi:hypothetical protein